MHEDTDWSRFLDGCLLQTKDSLYQKTLARHLPKPSHIHSRLWLKQTGTGSGNFTVGKLTVYIDTKIVIFSLLACVIVVAAKRTGAGL